MIITFVILILLLAFSASFSSFETALFSLSALQRHRLEKAGGISLILTKVLSKPRELLTTVLFGNELVNVAISILAGALAFDLFQEYGVKTVYLVSTSVTTLVILVFGEILPKNLAVRFPVFLAQVLIVPYQLFAWVVFPLSRVLSKMADFVIKLFGADPEKGRRLIVEEELRSLLELGKKEGTLADLERRLIQNALDFSKLKVGQAMTPWQKIIAVPIDISREELLRIFDEHRYSRLPVYEQNLDQVIGILYAKELLPSPENIPLSQKVRPCVQSSPEDRLDVVFRELQRLRIHMAIVRDAAGKVVGLITMDDLLRRFFKT